MSKWMKGFILLVLTGNAFSNEVSIPGYKQPVPPPPIDQPQAISITTPANGPINGPVNRPALSPEFIKKLDAEAKKVQNQKVVVLTAEQTAAWHDYLNKLRTCTEGDFPLAQASYELLQQYGKNEFVEVQGFDQDDFCHVSIKYYSEDDPRLRSGAVPSTQEMKQYPTGQDCKFTRGALQLFVSEQLAELNGKFDEKNPILEQAMSDQCSPFVMIDGEKNTVKPTLDQ